MKQASNIAFKQMKWKVMMVFLLFGTIPTILIAFVFFRNTSGLLYQKAIALSTAYADEIKYAYESHLASLEESIISLCSSKNIQAELKDNTNDYLIHRQFNYGLYNYTAVRPEIVDLCFVHPDGRIESMLESQLLLFNTPDTLTADIFTERAKAFAFDYTKQSQWTDMPVYQSAPANFKNNLILKYIVYDTDDYGIISTLLMHISLKDLKSIYRNTSLTEGRLVCLVDENGRVISSSDGYQNLELLTEKYGEYLKTNLPSNDTFIYDGNGEKYIAKAVKSDYADIYIVLFTPYNVITNDLAVYANIFCVILFFCIVCAIILGLLTVKIFYRLLRLKEMDIEALQSQINPHFLYNTIDIAAWYAKEIQADEIKNILISLSKYYRISLSSGASIISIKNELEHALLYGEIEKQRLTHTFTVATDIPEEILDYSIVKITLQPILENAIKHGIHKTVHQKGHIHISACLQNQDIIFTITDNGIGMTEEQMKNIMAASRSHSHGKKLGSGYGIANVNQRLKLTYGEQYGLRYHSALYEGTTVTIRLPANHYKM